MRLVLSLIVINMNTKLKGLLPGTKKNLNFISVLCGLLRKGDLRILQNHMPFSFITIPQREKEGRIERIQALIYR